MNFVTSNPGSNPIVVQASFPVAPSKVFGAWTKPESVKKWFGISPGTIEDATIDLAVGGYWRFVEAADDDTSTGFEGRYLEIEPDRRLVFSWTKFTEHPNGERTTTPPSQVEITFVETEHGTKMRIVHSAVDPSSRGFAIGWEAGIANLVALVNADR